MTILKFRPENRYRNQGTNLLNFSDIMHDYFGYSNANESNSGLERPRVNITEDKEEFRIEFALPGYSKEHIKIEVENEMLKVSGIYPTKEQQSGEYKRVEFNKSDFERSFILPDSIDSDQIKGSMENGILILQLPLKEEVKAKPSRNITIE
jgi:HSP20 family protein